MINYFQIRPRVVHLTPRKALTISQQSIRIGIERTWVSKQCDDNVVYIRCFVRYVIWRTLLQVTSLTLHVVEHLDSNCVQVAIQVACKVGKSVTGEPNSAVAFFSS